MHKAPATELAELVDEDFADRISAQPGFVSYEFLDGGEGEALSDFELTTTDTVRGQIKLTPCHRGAAAERAPRRSDRFRGCPALPACARIGRGTG